MDQESCKVYHADDVERLIELDADYSWAVAERRWADAAKLRREGITLEQRMDQHDKPGADRIGDPEFDAECPPHLDEDLVEAEMTTRVNALLRIHRNLVASYVCVSEAVAVDVELRDVIRHALSFVESEVGVWYDSEIPF